MDIDWSKAPEWANWLAQDECGEWFWFENKPELQSEGWDDDKTYNENKHEIAGVNGWKCSLQKRPAKPEPKEWDGEGLPPVGCECEINPHGEWFQAIVHGYGKNKFLAEISSFQTDSDGDVINGEHAYWTASTKFRPIRTQAEREREELVREAAHVIEMKNGSPITLYIKYCEDLYDAGLLRKGDA